MRNISYAVFCLKKKMTVLMGLITVIALGVIALRLIPMELIMKLEFPVIFVAIPYPGATPAQVESEVAIAAEGEFRTIPALKQIVTHCDAGGCHISMRFDWDTDLALAAADVRDRVERMRARLPDGVDRIYLRRSSSETWPVLSLALLRRENDTDLAHWARTVLQPRLMRIPGVAEVEVSGTGDERIDVGFDQAALRSYNLGLYDVVARLRSNSVNQGVGELYDGDSKYHVRAVDEVTSPQALRETIVGPNNRRLKDVADVEYRGEDGTSRHTIDGKHGVFISVRRESEANTIDVCEAVKAEVARTLEEPLFEGTELFVFSDHGETIRNAISKLREAGIQGGGLAILVLFLFLRRIRPTLIVALAIPVSLTPALIFMYFWGMTLNLVTLTSMIICVGMLVDNSIVVMENIARYTMMGYSPEESARRGANEVGLAITVATLTTVVVFVPVFYMENGEMAIHMREFSVPVTVALLASLAVALTAIPVAACALRPRHHYGVYRRLAAFFRGHGPLSGMLRWGPLAHAVTAYDRVLAWTMSHRLAAVCGVTLILLVTAYVPYRAVGLQQLPTLDMRRVEIAVSFDQNFNPDMTVPIFQSIEGLLNAQRGSLGIRNIYVQPGDRYGSVRLYLLQLEDCPPGAVLPYSSQEVREQLAAQLPPLVPGGKIETGVGGLTPQSERTLTLRLQGDDGPQLREHAEEVRRLIANIDGVTEVTTDADSGDDEIQLLIEQTQVAMAGTSPYVVARTVDFALRGVRLPDMKREGREIPLWARFRGDDRKSITDLDNVAVLTSSGSLVTLENLVRKQRAGTPTSITRVDGKNVVNITAKTYGRIFSKVKDDIAALTGLINLPPGYTLDIGDEAEELDTSFRNFRIALVFAIILIYIVMGALFESFVLPLSILSSVPLAFIGVYWSMYLSEVPLDSVSLIGVILMCGVIVNNGIVIVDHINQLRLRGQDRESAILQASRERLRPVLMTALTTILGCVPLAQGTQIGEVSFHSLGRALIGGLTTGTVLTLFIVPLFYSLIDDLGLWLRGYIANVVHTAARG